MRKKKNSKTLMFVCSTVMYKYMESLINDIHNLPDNMHVQIERYREFYHVIVYKAKEGFHIRI